MRPQRVELTDYVWALDVVVWLVAQYQTCQNMPRCIRCYTEVVFFKKQNREGGKQTKHRVRRFSYFFLILSTSHRQSFSRGVWSKFIKSNGLVRQPSCWAEPPRAVGSNRRGYKASPNSTGLFSSVPTSSVYTAGSGINFLSEACAAVSKPKFPGNIGSERPIDPTQPRIWWKDPVNIQTWSSATYWRQKRLQD